MGYNKVIGGEFRIDKDVLEKNIISYNRPKYSLGRTCLYAILNAEKSKVGGVLLPDYLCSSVVEVPLRLGMPIKHYHVEETTLLPDVSDVRDVLNKGRYAIVLVSYFGLIDLDGAISDIISVHPETIIIVDDVQNHYDFGNHIEYDYCFTSYRKWFAVPDGADVLQKRVTSTILECYPFQGEYVRYKYAGNILKNHNQIIGDDISLKLIEQGEKMMDEDYCFKCSKVGSDLLQRVDTQYEAEKRKKNAKILHEGLEKLGIKHLYNDERVPLFIPIIVHNRSKIRKALFSDNVFVPVHWPNVDVKKQGWNELYNTELSLICDQRYDKTDMERILRGIENAM